VAEEILHSVTHGIGALLALGGLATLVALAATQGGRALVGCSVYGVTLVLMYAASTAYHAVPFHLRRAKRALQIVDHCAIFLLIAGTYTPFTLVTLRGSWGFVLLGTVWSLAFLGIVAKTLKVRRFRTGPTLLYLAMGWMGLVAAGPLTRALPFGGVVLLACGGMAYTLGITFYVWHRLRYHHAIWHGFVLLGSVLHFLAVLLYVVPIAS
jgi:hemolysin III